MSLTRHTFAAVRMLLVCTLLLGVGYPALTWLVGRVAFADQAAGSLVERDGKIIGSSLMGQNFTGDAVFHSRPSASEYAGDVSGGTNLYAAAPDQQSAIAERQSALTTVGDVTAAGTSADALTASASGLDPHISPAYALAQVPRVAQATGLSPQQLTALVQGATSDRTLGFLGEPRVNVLLLNESLAAARH